MCRGVVRGAVDYLFKPVVPEVVKAKVAVFVEGREVWVRAWLHVLKGHMNGREPVVLLNDASTGHTFPAVPAIQSYSVSLEASNACSKGHAGIL